MQTRNAGKLCLPAMLALLGPGSVFHHLALESVLLHHAPPGSSLFLLYQCRPAVVIGKHQIPWEQARLLPLANHGIPLARRVTGGGTVWHDEGNLNWSFLEPADLRSRRERLDTIITSLRSVGLPVEAGERGDIWLDGKKVSGTALAYRRGMVLHHGTLLVSARLRGIHDFLGPPPGAIAGRGVASVPSPVMNLADVIPGLRPEDLFHPLLAAARSTSRARTQENPAPETDAIGLLRQAIPQLGADEAGKLLDDEAERLSGWDWAYGRTPDFRYRCYGQDLELEVRGGRLAGLFGANGEILEIPPPLQGLALHPGELDRVRLSPQSSGALACIRQLFG